MFCGLKKHWASAILASLIWTSQPLFAQVSKDRPPVTVLNLRTYGWQPPEPREVTRPAIALDHLGRVLVGFIVEKRQGLVTRAQPSLDFRIIRFSHDGELDLSLSLPTNAAGRTGIYLSDKDQIIARANDSLFLSLEKPDANSEEFAWEPLARCALRCLVEQSNSRHTLLLYTAEADPPTLIRLSKEPESKRCGKDPRFIESIEDKVQNYPTSITDDFAYSLGGGRAYRWPLCDYEQRVELPLSTHGRWKVLSDKVFLANQHNDRKNQSELEAISSDGQLKFRWGMAKHEAAETLWVPIRSSERGDRIAVDVLTLRGGNRTLDISSHVTARRIAVYDTEAGKEVASIPVSPKHRYRYEFDLSPDGKRLAILEDDTVKVVDLE